MIAYCEATATHCGQNPRKGDLAIVQYACSLYDSVGHMVKEHYSLPFNGHSAYGEFRAVLYAWLNWPEAEEIYTDSATGFTNGLNRIVNKGMTDKASHIVDWWKALEFGPQKAAQLSRKLRLVPSSGEHHARHLKHHHALGVKCSLLSNEFATSSCYSTNGPRKWS